MGDFVKNTIKLCLITLVAGVLLGVVYEVTKEPRKAQEEKTTQQAYQSVFKDADSFKELKKVVGKDNKEADIYKKVAKYVADSANEGAVLTESDVTIDNVVYAYAKDECKGCVVTVTSKSGFAGDIQFTVGVTTEGIVSGVSMLSIGETAGLGMKAKEEEFLKQYKTKEKVSEFQVTKKGEKGEQMIDAISGATITTNAVTDGVNAAMKASAYFMSLAGSEQSSGQESVDVSATEESKDTADGRDSETTKDSETADTEETSDDTETDDAEESQEGGEADE